MATNAPHRTPRACARLAAAGLVAASVFVAAGKAAATIPRVPGGGSPIVTGTAESDAVFRGRGRSDCPLRLPAPLPRRTRVVPILMYHRITVTRPSTPAVSRRLTVHPDVFRQQMRWLRRHGYRAITQRALFDALMCGRRLGPKPILITFDDGYRDVLVNAAPVLARLRMPATAYVISGRTSKGDSSFLTWRQLRVLESRGVEIGSHTRSHEPLTALSDARALAELAGARRQLARRLGHRVPWLAYPFGAYDARIERLARRAGYLLAVTTQWGARQSAARPFALGRLRITDSTGVGGLAAILAGIGR